MVVHMKNEHGRFGDKDRSYTCPNCHKTFKKNAQLRRHKRKDCGQEDQKVSCFNCSTLFTSQSELKNHMKTKHVKQNNANQNKLEIILENSEAELGIPGKLYDDVNLTQSTCDLCCQNFEGIEELTCHVERNHPSDLDKFNSILNYTGEEKN